MFICPSGKKQSTPPRATCARTCPCEGVTWSVAECTVEGEGNGREMGGEGEGDWEGEGEGEGAGK